MISCDITALALVIKFLLELRPAVPLRFIGGINVLSIIKHFLFLKIW